jgi:CheY-like chemotaxis protein
MGLFAEALRQRTREPEVAHLVNSVNESVDALEGLFSELLDITRIDSGGVEVRPSISRWARFCARSAPLRADRVREGTGAALRGGRHAVHADPLLVERIVRNLVSNAIRYTEDGSVLVSCRRRYRPPAGSGLGHRRRHRRAECDRVFEEFYQVRARAGAGRTPQGPGSRARDRGAAGRLMEAPLSVRSALSRGSVFTLSLPVGQAPANRAEPCCPQGPDRHHADRRLVVIVEDEPAVREGLAVLLAGWGRHAGGLRQRGGGGSVGAGERSGVDAAGPRHRRLPPRGGPTGIDALVALRRRFGAALPVIVVTGSTTSGHEAEAQAHDFHLLIKPVLPNKLRR